MDKMRAKYVFRRRVICILLIILNVRLVVSQETVKATEILYGEMHTSDGLSFVEMLGGSSKGSYSIVKWTYHINISNYDANASTPILYFRHIGQEGYDSSKRCFHGESFLDLYSYDPRLVPLQEYKKIAGLDKECLLKNNTLHCIGMLKFAVARQVQWYVSIGFQCSQERSLDLSFNLSLTAYSKVKCNPISHSFESLEGPIPMKLIGVRIWCAPYSAHYSDFNVIGFNDYDFYRAFQVRSRALDLHCYQYIARVLCGYLLPSCEDGIITLPCRDICEEFKRGCNSLADVIQCNSLVSKDSGTNCSYEAVDCGLPPNITEHAEVTFSNDSTASSIVKATCKTGYIPYGDPIARCELNGQWVYDEHFECVKKVPKPPVIMISSICTSIIVLVMIVLTIFGATYKVELKILSRKYVSSNPCGRPPIIEPKCFHACFSYDDECPHSEENVKGIKYTLDSLGYKTYASYDDAGFGISAVVRIPAVVSQSYRVVIILNQRYLNSTWCNYELENSFIQWIEEKKFDLIIILTEDKKSLKNIPRYLKAYLRLNMYLSSSDPKLLPKLQKLLPCLNTSHLVPEVTYVDDPLLDPLPVEDAGEMDELIELN